MSDNISIAGIEKAVSALEYRNSRSLKYRLIHAIKQYYDSDQSLRAIDSDELVPLVWDNVINPNQMKSKKKNLNSIRSSINSDLMKLFRDGKNPEGIIIDPSNVFSMCDEAKDAFLKSFTSALASDEPITLDSISEVTRLFGEFLNKVPDDNSLEFVGSILDALSSKKPLPIEKAAEVLGMFDNLITNMPDSQILKEHDTVRALLDKLADKAGWTPPAKASDDGQSVTVSAAHEGIDSLSEEDISKLDTIDEEEMEEVGPADDQEEDVEYIESQEPEDDSEIVEVVEVDVEDEEKDESDEDAETVEDEDLSELDELEEVEEDELEESEEEEQLDDEDLEEVESTDEEEDSEVVEVLDVVVEDEGKDGAGEDEESVEDEDLSELDELEEVEDDELEESEEEEELDDEDLEEVESLDDEEEAGGDESEEDSEVVEVLDVVLEDEASDEAGEDEESGEDEDLSELDELEEVEDDELDDSEEEEGQLDEEELEEVDEIDDLVEESELDDEDGDSESDSDVVEVLDVMVDDEDDIEEVEVFDDEIEEEVEDDDVTVVEEPGEEAASADFEGKYDIDEDEFDLEDLPETERKRILAERFDRYLGAMERHFNQFLLIPSGAYTIGSKIPSPGELPEQQIQVHDFFMGKYPVINALFEVFVERTGYTTTAEKKGFGVVYEGRFRKIKDEKTGQYRFAWNATHSWKEVKGAYWYQPTGPGSTLHQKRNHPVVQVSLLDAMAFASWVGKRLPTAAEWEAAARTDKGYRFPWGDDWKDGLCNTETSEIADTMPVDHYPDAVNKMGIANLLGNTLEWTSEKCNPPNGSRNDFDYHIAKGGSWVSEENIQLDSRFRFPTDFTSNTLGFRCLAD